MSRYQCNRLSEPKHKLHIVGLGSIENTCSIPIPLLAAKMCELAA